MKKPLSQLKQSIEQLGIDHRNGRCGPRPVMFLLLLLFLISNVSQFIFYNWDDLNKRVKGIKGLAMYCTCLAYLLPYLTDWDRSSLLLAALDDSLYRFPYRPTIDQLNSDENIRKNIVNLNTVWYHGCVIFSVIEIAMTVLIFVLRILQTDDLQNVSIETLYLPIPFHFPRHYKTLRTYSISVILQAIFLLYGRIVVYTVLAPAFVSLHLIEGDLKLLRLSIEGLDDLITREFRVTKYSAQSKEPCATNQDECRILQSLFLHIINHHQAIYRKVTNVTKGISIVAISTNSGLSFHMCLSIYITLQSQNLMTIIPEVFYFVILVFTLYCCNVMGERISIEDEDVRKALYECGWVDKPKLFQKSLQIIMARTNQPIEIISVGLFALNLKTFSMTIRTAYSFYNLLNNFKQ